MLTLKVDMLFHFLKMLRLLCRETIVGLNSFILQITPLKKAVLTTSRGQPNLRHYEDTAVTHSPVQVMPVSVHDNCREPRA